MRKKKKQTIQRLRQKETVASRDVPWGPLQHSRSSCTWATFDALEILFESFSRSVIKRRLNEHTHTGHTHTHIWNKRSLTRDLTRWRKRNTEWKIREKKNEKNTETELNSSPITRHSFNLNKSRTQTPKHKRQKRTWILKKSTKR